MLEPQFVLTKGLNINNFYKSFSGKAIEEYNSISLSQRASEPYLDTQRVIWTPRTLFFDSLDTQKFRSGFAEDDFS